MRYPKFLREGDTIGFVAPSFGCSTEPYKTCFESAQESFKEMGYRIWLGPNCYEDSGIGISSRPDLCAREFEEAFCDDQSDILLSCGGGELMCEILPHLDFDRLSQAQGKWFMGYSDNTNLSFLLVTLCDIASIYGPNGPAFGMEPWHPSLKAALKLLSGMQRTVHGYSRYEKESLKDEEHPLLPINAKEPSRKVSWPDPEGARFKGRLVGGCLDCLVNLCGTGFDQVKAFEDRYREDGLIWYLEACDLNVFGIRRALWELKEAGWFETARGFLIGRPLNGESLFGLDRFQAVTDILGELDLPILMDLDLGHLPPQMPLVGGSLAEVSMKGNDVKVKMIFK